ncbi:MAG: TRAP transporter substrate-binding protein [Lawsonibacter sp.]|jgi:tripartite ATP-independent transporter DctP family solute receptor
MKKVLALLLSGAMMVSLLAGCGSKETGSAGSTGGSQAGSSGQEELPSYSFQLGYNTVEDSVRGEMATVFKNYVEETSNGRMTVEIFPFSTLGSEQEMVEMVKTGSLDFTLPGVSALSNIDPNFGAYNLPFVVNNWDDAHAMLDGDFGNTLKDIAMDNGYKILGWGDLGTVQITNNGHPINSLADMKGLNMRSTNEEVSLRTFEALGCSVTTLAFSELYLGLSQGVVDGQFNPIDAIYQNSFTEVQDYLAMVNMYFYGITLLMSNDKFNAMDAESQQILLDGAAKAQEAGRAYCANAEEEYLQKVIDEECFKEITYPDTTEFKEAVSGVYDSYLANCDPRIVEAVNALR